MAFDNEPLRHGLSRRGIPHSKSFAQSPACPVDSIGLHCNVPDSQFDPRQLQTGIRIEMEEHTKNPVVAKEIAKDHLSEHPDYYSWLVEMEMAAAATNTFKKLVASQDTSKFEKSNQNPVSPPRQAPPQDLAFGYATLPKYKGGSGAGKLKVGKKVTKPSQFKVGETYIAVSNQFKSINVMKVKERSDGPSKGVMAVFVDPNDPRKKRLSDDREFFIHDFQLKYDEDVYYEVR